MLDKMAKIPFQLDVLRLLDPDSQSRGGVIPTAAHPALCARDPRLVKSAVPIRQPDWLPPASTLTGARASSAPALVGPFLSSLPSSLSLFLPLEPVVIGFVQMPIRIGLCLHTYPLHLLDWLLSRHLSQLAGFQSHSLSNPLLLRAFA